MRKPSSLHVPTGRDNPNYDCYPTVKLELMLDHEAKISTNYLKAISNCFLLLLTRDEL